MQTFLPYPEFDKSAAVLDRQRLGKQRVEAYQIMRAIAHGGGWSNHPITKMWMGFENALKRYSNVMIEEWIRRGYKNTMPLTSAPYLGEIVFPPWLGDERVHTTHRGRLLHKDPDWYERFGWLETPIPPEEGYFWPL